MASPGLKTARVRRTWPDPGWAVLLLLGLLWLLLLGQAEPTPMARVLLLDELWYLDQAVAPEGPPHFMSPLYPGLLRLSGVEGPVPDALVQDPSALRAMRLFQILCWLGTVGLLRLIAGRVMSDLGVTGRARLGLAWLPPLLFAMYAPAAVYTLTLLVEVPLVFLVTLFFYLLPHGRHRPWALPLAALVLGVAGLLRTSTLVLWPLLLWQGWGLMAGRRRLAGVGLLLLATALPLAVPSGENSRHAGHLAGPTLNGGLNFHIGNGPDANGFYTAPADLDWRSDPAGVSILRNRYGRAVAGVAEADAAWWRMGLVAVRENPLRSLGLWGRKVWLHLQAWEIDQLTPLAAWTSQVPLLKAFWVPWGLLVMLGLTGVGARRLSGVQMWLAAVGLLVTGQSLFFVVSRYRLVLVPLLCLLAAAGLGRLWLWWQGRREAGARFPRAVIVALVLGGLVITPWQLTETRARWRPLIQANEGRRWAILGEFLGSDADLAKAEALYRSAVATGPDSAEPWLGLAAVLEARDNRPEARRVLLDSEKVLPRHLATRKMRLTLMLSDGHRSDALELARRILADHPRDADTLHNASVLLAGFGNMDAALVMARRLFETHPEDPQGAVDLGVLLARAGDLNAAADVFRQGLRRNPGHPALLRNLDLVAADR